MNKRNKNGLATAQVEELVYQALETELGGVQVYRTALELARNAQLCEEWEKYLAETETHVERLEQVCVALGMDPELETPGRLVVRHIGKSLVKAMKMAAASGTPEGAELVAAECVTLAETKDHMNWELLGKVAKKLSGPAGRVMTEAYEEIEVEEDEHLYHTTGWLRELWIKSLGMKAVLPPPEETQHVTTAISAARVKHARVG
jgi:rubrerythrin